VLFNTWMWSLAGDRHFEWPARLMSSRLGRLLYERLGFAVNVLWRRAVRDTRYTSKVHAQYAAALRDPAARHASWIYARELLGSSPWFDALWQRRDRITSLPTLLVWGTKDPAFATALPRWRAALTDAEIVEWADVGHAPSEARGPESAALVRRFLEAPRRTP
jgi:haloalkane dehalogenase